MLQKEQLLLFGKENIKLQAPQFLKVIKIIKVMKIMKK